MVLLWQIVVMSVNRQEMEHNAEQNTGNKLTKKRENLEQKTKFCDLITNILQVISGVLSATTTPSFGSVPEKFTELELFLCTLRSISCV